MNKSALVKQARKMNHEALMHARAGRHNTAALCRDFRNINMRYAREV